MHVTRNDERPQAGPGTSADPERAWRNVLVLDAAQASLGLIGPDVRGIAVDARKDGNG